MKADELRALCRRVATAWKVYRMDDRDQDSYYAVADAHRAMSMVNANASEQVAAGITEALDDERRQTQRRMIAALYWLAGACFLQSDMARARAGAEVYGALAVTPMRYSLEQHSCGMAHWSAANAMERAL